MHLNHPVPWAAVPSKAAVLLLLIYCFMYFPLIVGVSVLVFVLLCIILCPLYICNHLEEEEKACCLADELLS